MKKSNLPQGYVTITILILVMVLMVITYLVAAALLSELTIARNNKASQIAFSLADAGVQEAIYRVQYTTAAKNSFIGTTGGTYTFDHAPALINGGSYNVTIQNTAKGVATIDAIGTYTLGGRVAHREIHEIIAQATVPQYNADDAMYTISTNCSGCQSTGDITFKGTDIKIYDGGLSSGRSFDITQSSSINIEKGVHYATGSSSNYNIDHGSELNFNCFIDADPDPLLPPPLCSDASADHLPTAVAAGQMPMIDFDSTSPNSYKNQAIAQSQYFSTPADFYAHFFPAGTSAASASGVVYVEGSLDISSGRTFTMTGVLAATGSIDIGKSNQVGEFVIVSPGANQPSGVLTQASLNLNAKGNLSGTGLVWVGEGFIVDNDAAAAPLNLTGGILSRRITITDRHTTIHFDPNVINFTIGNPNDTPVIEINHWEEEY